MPTKVLGREVPPVAEDLAGQAQQLGRRWWLVASSVGMRVAPIVLRWWIDRRRDARAMATHGLGELRERSADLLEPLPTPEQLAGQLAERLAPRRPATLLGCVAAEVGKGLVAGLVGTAAITLSQKVEARLRKREPSGTPADAVGKVLGWQPVDEAARARAGTLVHWGYGTAWGGVRGLVGAAGLDGPAGAATHFGLIVGASMVGLPALGVVPPVTEWSAPDIATDLFHHAVYATATQLAYAALG